MLVTHTPISLALLRLDRAVHNSTWVPAEVMCASIGHAEGETHIAKHVVSCLNTAGGADAGWCKIVHVEVFDLPHRNT